MSIGQRAVAVLYDWWEDDRGSGVTLVVCYALTPWQGDQHIDYTLM